MPTPPTPDFRLVYITAPTAEAAQELGRHLVEQRLAACANILPGVTSIYRWEGRLCEDPEAVLIAKTRADLVDPLIAVVVARHPYACPCVVALPILAGHPPYLQWLAEMTRPEDPA